MIVAYKGFLSDLARPSERYCSLPVWDGHVPFTLPSERRFEPGRGIRQYGWHARETPLEALRSCGLWSDGRPSRLFRLESMPGSLVEEDLATSRQIKRYNAAQWRVVQEISVSRMVADVAAMFCDRSEELTHVIRHSLLALAVAPTPAIQPYPKTGSGPALDKLLKSSLPHLFDAAWDLFDSKLTETRLDSTGRGEMLCCARDYVFREIILANCDGVPEW